MSPAVIALIALLAIAVVVAVVLVIRMNREPEVARDETEMLPLFTSQGVMTEGYRPDDGAEPDEAAIAERATLLRDVARREALQREAAKLAAAQRESSQREAAQREASRREASQREAVAMATKAAPEATASHAANTPEPLTVSPAELERMKAAASAAPNGALRTPAAPSAPRPQSTPSIRTFNTATPLRQAPPAAASASASTVAPASAPTARSSAPSPNSPVRATSGESTVHFNIPNDGTLQFLPGRLEVASGQDSGREIRFVRLPGPTGSEFTFGRSEGELYRHIQLRDQTVSRAHAKMRFAEGRWFLQNLSHTNPVVHDGRPLATGEELPLDDGARIEMGEVLFAFKNR